MPRKTSAPRKPESVFLNLPFDKEFERIFVAYVVGLVTIGFVPRSVLDLDEDGSGRMSRLFQLVNRCEGSVHDLSYSGPERRYNMPFELGVAYALTQVNAKKIYVFERRKYCLQKELSDLKHFDPKIHNMRGETALAAIYECFESRTLLNPISVGLPIYRLTIKRLSSFRQRRKTIFNRTSLRLLLYYVGAMTASFKER